MTRLICLLFLIANMSAAGADAKKIETAGLKNMYLVSENLYRSEQPTQKAFAAIEKTGIKSVLNLREYHSDEDEAKDTTLVLYRVKLAAGKLTSSDLAECLAIIKLAPKPVLVHCLHGSDRTGAVVAAYRIVFENMSRQEAIDELCLERYGHHKTYYRNIRKLIEELDINQLKKDVAEHEKALAHTIPGIKQESNGENTQNK